LYEKDLIRKVSKTQGTLFSDFFRSLPTGAVRIDVMAAVIDSYKRTVAVLILQINPERDLYPLLDFWPSPSESSETYIVRRENDQFLLMNKLRTDPQRELIKILPLRPSTIKAFEESIESGNIFEGKDSRGKNVVAYLSKIPGTDWILVTQVDKSEILTDARYHAHFIAIIVLLLILIAIFGSGFIYKQQRMRIYKELFKLERKRNEILEEFKTTLYSIGDGVISMDETGRIRHMNPVAERLTG